MALGYTTYKTPNAIFTIDQDFTGKEGCGVTLTGQGDVRIATFVDEYPYGIIVVGGESSDGTYPGLIGGSAVEFVDMVGCVVQVQISATSAVNASDFLLIDAATADGTFTVLNTPPVVGEWFWGIALTNAGAGEQCLMRFQPLFWQMAPPPP